ncbi:hypothetical protein MTO96_029512 [Rhipicephalus appendiculatus]
MRRRSERANWEVGRSRAQSRVLYGVIRGRKGHVVGRVLIVTQSVEGRRRRRARLALETEEESIGEVSDGYVATGGGESGRVAVAAAGHKIMCEYRGMRRVCARCGDVGHTATACTAEYCKRCGTFGHGTDGCEAECKRCGGKHGTRECFPKRSYVAAARGFPPANRNPPPTTGHSSEPIAYRTGADIWPPGVKAEDPAPCAQKGSQLLG